MYLVLSLIVRVHSKKRVYDPVQADYQLNYRDAFVFET